MLQVLYDTSRVPVEGKSSVCTICMKYRIIIVIIIIISLGQIILSFMANYITHACMHAHAHMHTRTPTPVAVQVIAVRSVGVRPTMTKIRPLFACSADDEWPVGASFK